MKKKFLIVIGIIVLSIALVGFWGYNKYFTPNPETQQQLADQFGEDFFSFDDEEALNDSGTVNNVKPVDELDKVKELEDGENVTPSTSSNPTTPTTSTTPKTPTNESVVEKQITQEDINNKYMGTFNSLQNVAMSRLDTLYSAAVQEYAESVKTGQVNRSALAQKYIQAGTTLEANVDKQFYKTLDMMQAELIANNLPTDSVGVYKSTYENAKSAKRSQLWAEVRR